MMTETTTNGQKSEYMHINVFFSPSGVPQFGLRGNQNKKINYFSTQKKIKCIHVDQDVDWSIYVKIFV